MRLLARESNIKGSLFSRLVADVFLALGYEDPRLNIQKAGREVDVVARHRVEPKYAIAECKATKNPIGGADLNKFAGVLQAEESAKGEDAVQGYFISLSGFTEAAMEQEAGFSSPRFVCLDGLDAQHQLVAGLTVVSPQRVGEIVGGLMAESKLDTLVVRPPELVGHALGWIWLSVLERDHAPTYFSLVHADGQPLSPGIAERFSAYSDGVTGATLGDLGYLAPKETKHRDSTRVAERRYRDYLMAELGDITLEGLPADEDAGVKRIALEDLYVPLRVERLEEGSGATFGGRRETAGWDGREEGAGEPESIGWVLTHSRRLAVLGAPGSGKSTLIKRLAVAYVDESHRDRVNDELPDRGWLPLLIRCRDLGTDQREMSFREILDDTPRRGEFPELAESFAELIANALQSGQILLLIDGLDEVSDAGNRLAFVRKMRTFLSVYPNVGLLVTSREPGFRSVAGALSSICTWYRLAEFVDTDIHQLTKAWHATVVGRSPKVAGEAEELAQTIVATDRVRRLARNPLLLTTLLLVKRWVGDLPRKRTVLYEKAIEVLLMTWNVAAYEPIAQDEAIPQLAFVAHSLTERGVQSVSAVELTDLLNEARSQMPEVLGFARTSVVKFVERIEGRSSLLIMTGHVEERGRLVPVYEFRHLTFQEYLAALALVEGFYSGHRDGDRLAGRLASHVSDPQWFEVLTLVNVLAGRSAGDVIAAILCSGREALDPSSPTHAKRLLGRALADEVQMPPGHVSDAAFAFGRLSGEPDPEIEELVVEILEGRYGDAFRATVEAGYRDDSRPHFAEFAHVYASCLESRLPSAFPEAARAQLIGKAIQSDDEGAAAAAAMEAAVWGRQLWEEGWVGVPTMLEPMRMWAGQLTKLCEIGRPYVAFAAVSALAWVGRLDLIDIEDRLRVFPALLALWRHSWCPQAQLQAAWAITCLSPVERSLAPFGAPDVELCSFLENQSDIFDRKLERRADRARAALTVAYYFGEPWSDREIARRIKTLPKTGDNDRRSARLPELT
ncbi:MAG: NACHT domain-containing protein [Solirubrobacterales bacterium]